MTPLPGRTSGIRGSGVPTGPAAWGGRAAAVIGAAGLLSLTAGIAYGLWSASGTGPGAARAQTAQALAVSAGTAGAQLFPGSTGDVIFSVSNPNSYAVRVEAATMSAVTGTSSGSCGADQFTLSSGTVTPTTIPPGGAADVTVAGAIGMVLSAPDACQGVTVSVTGTLTGSQA